MWMRYVLSDCLFAQSFYDIGDPYGFLPAWIVDNLVPCQMIFS